MESQEEQPNALQANEDEDDKAATALQPGPEAALVADIAYPTEARTEAAAATADKQTIKGAPEQPIEEPAQQAITTSEDNSKGSEPHQEEAFTNADEEVPAPTPNQPSAGPEMPFLN